MGVVWLARDEKLDRDVALKFLPELIVHDAAVLDEMKRETKRSLELTHHNIVRIYDFADDNQSACISMEYVDGPTLSALRVERPDKVFKVAEIAPWIEQTCEALVYAHERAKIVHRDLKPANLMLNSKGDLKVADFGIARSLTDSVSMLTMARGTSGTLVYMSPQQIDGKRASHLDDIYSLGATIYELLTSKPPFYSGAIEHQIKEIPVPSMADRRVELGIAGAEIPPVWEQTVATCLAKEPPQRLQTAAAVANTLGLRSTGYVVPPVIRPTAATEIPRKRKTAPFLIGGAAALVVLAVIGYYGWQRSQGTRPQPGTTAHPQPTLSASSPQPIAVTSPQIAGASPAVSVSPVTTPSIAPVAVGSVSVSTKPTGAIVTVDDQSAKTPATFNDIKIGNQTFRIMLDGYEPIEREVDVKENEKVDLGEILLERSRGSAEITSVPKGIAFELIDSDGEHHKGKTPASINAPVGSAKVIFQPKGAPNHKQQVSIMKNNTASVNWGYAAASNSPVPAEATKSAAVSSSAAKYLGTWRVSGGIYQQSGSITISVNAGGKLTASGEVDIYDGGYFTFHHRIHGAREAGSELLLRGSWDRSEDSNVRQSGDGLFGQFSANGTSGHASWNYGPGATNFVRVK